MTPEQLLNACRDLALHAFVLGQRQEALERENRRLRDREVAQQEWIRTGVHNITDRLNHALAVANPEPTAMELGVIEAAGRVKQVMETVLAEQSAAEIARESEVARISNGAYRP